MFCMALLYFAFEQMLWWICTNVYSTGGFNVSQVLTTQKQYSFCQGFCNCFIILSSLSALTLFNVHAKSHNYAKFIQLFRGFYALCSCYSFRFLNYFLANPGGCMHFSLYYKVNGKKNNQQLQSRTSYKKKPSVWVKRLHSLRDDYCERT